MSFEDRLLAFLRANLKPEFNAEEVTAEIIAELPNTLKIRNKLYFTEANRRPLLVKMFGFEKGYESYKKQRGASAPIKRQKVSEPEEFMNKTEEVEAKKEEYAEPMELDIDTQEIALVKKENAEGLVTLKNTMMMARDVMAKKAEADRLYIESLERNAALVPYGQYVEKEKSSATKLLNWVASGTGKVLSSGLFWKGALAVAQATTGIDGTPLAAIYDAVVAKTPAEKINKTELEQQQVDNLIVATQLEADNLQYKREQDRIQHEMTSDKIKRDYESESLAKQLRNEALKIEMENQEYYNTTEGKLSNAAQGILAIGAIAGAGVGALALAPAGALTLGGATLAVGTMSALASLASVFRGERITNEDLKEATKALGNATLPGKALDTVSSVTKSVMGVPVPVKVVPTTATVPLPPVPTAVPTTVPTATTTATAPTEMTWTQRMMKSIGTAALDHLTKPV